MNYYILDLNTDTKTVGSAPWGPLELNEPLGLRSILEYGNGLPSSAEFRLKGNSRLTDYTYCMHLNNVNFFIISPKMRSVLERFNLQKHIWADCKIFRKDSKWEYSMLRFIEFRDRNGYVQVAIPDMIDFSNSVFCESDFCGFPLTGNEPIVQIDSYEDYLEVWDEFRKRSANLELRFVKLSFNESYLVRNKIDMCWLFPLHSNPLISERLKDTLIKNDITGLNLMNVNDYPTREFKLW
ncbi:MAG: hypothetical protein IKG81_03745 [Bacteroidales bacterium]|nr:hypothetical protein [Bacteroidales bacterium]